MYEPVIVVQFGEARETSWAAEPELARHAKRCYHRECHEASHGAGGSIDEQPEVSQSGVAPATVCRLGWAHRPTTQCQRS